MKILTRSLMTQLAVALALSRATLFGAPVPPETSELYMAGDSIMTDYRPNEWPQYGWGRPAPG